jgi:hypothetical protein
LRPLPRYVKFERKKEFKRKKDPDILGENKKSSFHTLLG